MGRADLIELEEPAQCGYHLGPPVKGCRLAQLRTYYDGQVHWTEWNILLCPDCREHLRGLFRYVKEKRDD